MAIQEIWLANLIRLVEIEGNGNKRNGIRQVADVAGLSEEYVYQLVEGKKKSDGTPRQVGKTAAKKIAEKFLEDRPKNWFDLEDGLCKLVAGKQKNKPDELVIPQFETGGSMGRGLVLRDQPGVIKSWKVSSEWIQKNVPSHSGDANLCIVTGFGPSMRPLFNPGDPLLVDRGVRHYEGDAIYFFRVGDEGFIKSLQSIPGDGLRVISANREHFDAWTIKPDMDFEVFGRVLKVWKSEDF